MAAIHVPKVSDEVIVLLLAVSNEVIMLLLAVLDEVVMPALAALHKLIVPTLPVLLDSLDIRLDSLDIRSDGLQKRAGVLMRGLHARMDLGHECPGRAAVIEHAVDGEREPEQRREDAGEARKLHEHHLSISEYHGYHFVNEIPCSSLLDDPT